MRLFATWLVALFTSAPVLAVPANTAPIEGFADTNGVRLQYLDWGGTGRPYLIFIHGTADNPHAFDDFAPAFTKRFHVIAYARRGCGNSEVKGPYDIETLTQDLKGLMDGLKIQKADLVGYSAGGAETTSFAATYPERVNRIVYLEAAYDWTDPEWQALLNLLPVPTFGPPATAMASLDAYRAYIRATSYPQLSDADMGRIEANLRGKIVVHPDGTLTYRTPKEVIDAIYTAQSSDKGRQYTRLRCPVLAIYSEDFYDEHVADLPQRNKIVRFEQQYWRPFQRKSMKRVRHEIANVELAEVPGAHGSFLLTSRKKVVGLLQRFLISSVQPGKQ